jgi:hypothetical protein
MWQPLKDLVGRDQQHLACHTALLLLLRGVRGVCSQDVHTRCKLRPALPDVLLTIENGVGGSKKPWVVARNAANHHTIHSRAQVVVHIMVGLHATIQFHVQMRVFTLKPVHPIIAEGHNFVHTVLARRSESV